MARAPQQGGVMTVWMIVFAALWLASTVLLVILYTGQEELREKARRLEEENARLVSPTERGAVPLVQAARRGGPTVVGLLEEARATTAELAVGDRTADAAAVRNQLAEFLRILRSDRVVPDAERFHEVSFHQALTMLYEKFKAEAAAYRNAADRVTELEAEVERLASAAESQKSEFEKRIQELADQLDEVEADRNRFRQESAEQVAELERTFEEWRQQTDADLTKERLLTASLRDHAAKLEERLSSLQQQCAALLPGPQPLATARQPDGRILKAIPGDEVVYVDLGRKHRLTLGLRFAVYGAETGIPQDGRAKGQLEVVSVQEESAECQKLWVAPGAVLLEGDLIANPIYDPTRPTEFVVIGEFDLDRDGMTDPEDSRAVEAIISEWGGYVSSELTALTDFLVVGRAPPQPRRPRDETPDRMTRYNAALQARENYDTMIEQARSLAVPVLNQELFLNFLGERRQASSP